MMYLTEIILRRMTQQSQVNVAQVVSNFRGVYARVARKLNVSASYVSRVASGERKSTEIETELREELKKLKDKLNAFV
jgi:transcriptional regulator with XRE-family HTH domain